MLENYAKESIFKGKKLSLRIRKRFYRVERCRIERQRSKNKKETEELLFKPIIVSIYDMDRFVKKK